MRNKKVLKLAATVGVVFMVMLAVFVLMQPTATVAAKGGGGKGGGEPKCCDPARQPGVGGNPFCFEGATCCSDGQWRCNNANGTPSCTAGQVCS